MPDVVRSTEAGDGQSLIQRPLSRRQVLRGGLIASGAAFLAACGSAATPAPATPAPATAAPATAAPATAAPVENFAGVELHNMTGGYMIPYLDLGTAKWNAETGGTAVSDNTTFAEKQIKQAGIIATQDSSWDMMYTTEAYGYMFKFGPRLLEPVEPWFGDISDFSAPAVKALTSPDGVFRALPLYAFPSVWAWNKKHFEAIGEDPENPPDTYDALFDLTPKFVEKGIIPCVQPWLATQSNLFALLYFTKMYNSLHHPMFSEDRTQLLFGGEEGLETFRTIEKGIKTGFWDPKYMNITNEHDAFVIYSEGNVACVMHSESPVLEGEMATNTGVRQFPGIKPGMTGSTGGADGLGISKFTRNRAACESWAKVTFSAEIARAAALSETKYPVARDSVLADPEVQAHIPLLVPFAAQNKGQTALWPTPYNIDPVFNEVLAKMIGGEYTAAQAHDAAVKGTQDEIIKYLSS
jgi:ABC-type glycerol-3-phosphate transport system substrate-binding protein